MLFLEFCLLSACQLSTTESQGREFSSCVIKLGIPPALAGILSSGAATVGCLMPQYLKLRYLISVFEDC